MKKNVIIGILILLALTLGILLTKNTTVKELPKDRIFVSTTNDTKKLSDFDHWLIKDYGCKWVPSYLVLDGHDVIGIINGNISNQEFKTKLKILQENPIKIEIDNHDIYNVFTKTTTNWINVLNKNKLNIIEIHMYGCPDCEMADGIPGTYDNVQIDNSGNITTNSTITIKEGDIGSTYKIMQNINAEFYRYYIKSTYQNVLDTYKGE